MQPWTLAELQQTEWFGSLIDKVQKELDRLSADQVDRRPALEHEYEALQARISGWTQTLGKPDLGTAIREAVESQMEQAFSRMRELQRQLSEHYARCAQARRLVEPQQVVHSLNRLAEVLSKNEPTRGNLELSLHIDCIRCFPDGKVTVRTCKLGALAGAIDVFSSEAKIPAEDESSPGHNGVAQATPRRRARLRTEDRDEHGNDLRAAALQAADVHRFAGLGPEWFSEEILQVPAKAVWSTDNAAAVAAKQKEMGWSLRQLAGFFKVSKPTIQKALRKARLLPPHDA